MLKENFNKTTKSQKILIALLFAAVLIIWFVSGYLSSSELNRNGVVTIAVVSSSNNNNVLYNYLHDGYVYEGVYSFSPNYDIPRSVGELIYVMYSPDEPAKFSIAVHKTVKVPSALRFGEKVESVEKVKVKWWYSMELPFWQEEGVPYSEFKYPKLD